MRRYTCAAAERSPPTPCTQNTTTLSKTSQLHASTVLEPAPQAPWSLPLKLRPRRGDPSEDNAHTRGDSGNSSDSSGSDGGLEELEDEGEEEEEEEEEHGLLGMGGFGGEGPANVAVTESVDGCLVVAVVRSVS